ncbi:MAG: ABC transporter permease [Planctomycetes bacterium]|nr:ABC transporter permease [Planctomycetota bacterium]
MGVRGRRTRLPRSVPSWFRSGHRELGLCLLIAAVLVGIGMVDPRFHSTGTWNDLLVRSAPTMIVACGVTLVVLTGEIDVSVGSQMAFLAAILGTMVSRTEWNLSPWIGLPATLAAGAAIGMLNGILVTIGRVPSIVATLGVMTALRGATTWMMGGSNIEGLPDALTRAAKQGLFRAGPPLGVVVAAGTAFVCYLLLHHMPLGRHLYAVGGGREAARLAGLSEIRLKWFAFAVTGFLVALATIVDVPRLPKIEAGIGVDFELLVITCVVVGGVSISGGRGRLGGVLLAVLLMTLIRPVLTFLEIGESGEKWAKAVQGVMILAAVLSDRAASRGVRREP